MKIKKFKYKDEERELFQMNNDEKHIAGIDLTKLSDEEIKSFLKTQKEYEEKIKPFVKKAYRNFIKENILNEEEIKI